MTRELRIIQVSKWEQRKGKASYLRYLRGQRISMRQGIEAKCFDCLGGYPEGAEDCNIPTCSLYGWMPYRGKAIRKQ